MDLGAEGFLSQLLIPITPPLAKNSSVCFAISSLSFLCSSLLTSQSYRRLVVVTHHAPKVLGYVRLHELLLAVWLALHFQQGKRVVTFGSRCPTTPLCCSQLTRIEVQASVCALRDSSSPSTSFDQSMGSSRVMSGSLSPVLHHLVTVPDHTTCQTPASNCFSVIC